MKSPARYIADFVVAGNNILDASVTLADLGPDVLANLASAGANIAGLTTSNIAEGSNLYYTDERVYANINPLLANLDIGANLAASNTDALAEGIINLYYTDERVQTKLANVTGNILPDTDTNYDIGSLDLRFRDLYLSGNSLYLANVVLREVSGELAVASIEPDGNLGNSIPLSLAQNNTDSLLEGTNNLYFTNTRAIGSLTAGTGITIAANGLVINTGTSSNTIVYLSSQTLVANGSTTDFILSTAPGSAQNIMVAVNGVIQIPTTDYTVNSTILSFTSAPTDESNIEVRYFLSTEEDYASVSFTTSNIAEGSNLYYTDERVYANITPLLANLDVGANLAASNTDSLAEGAINFYYTDERVYANISPLLFSGEYSDLANTPTIPAFTSNLTNDSSFITSAFLTTSNVTEGNNLYYTDERVYANVVLNNFATESYVDTEIANLVNSAPEALDTLNELASALGNDASFSTTVTNSIGNIQTLANAAYAQANAAYDYANTIVTYTDADAYANISPLLYNDDKVQAKLANVTGNILPDTDVVYDIGSPDLRFRDLYLSGNSIHLGGIVVRNVNNRLAVARASAGQIQESLPVSLSENDTDDLAEGNNLYFTNARVYANVSPLINAIEQYSNAKVYANVAPLLANLPAGYTDEDAYANISPLLFSGDYNDLTNKPNIPSLSGYATESYVDSAVANLVNSAPSTLDTLNELATALGNDADFSNTVVTSIATKASNAYVQAELSALSDYVMNTVSGIVTFSGDYNDLTNKPNIPSLSGYATEAYVDNATANVSVNLAGYATEAFVANSISTLDTSNISEGTNLYFTNARVYANIAPLLANVGGGGGTSYDSNTDSTGYFALPIGTEQQRPNAAPLGAIRYNTNIGGGEVYTATGWSPFGAQPPVINSVVPSNYNGEQGTAFTINGVNFTNDALIFFIDNTGTSYQAAVTTFNNSTTMTGTTPRDFTVAEGPLDVKVSGLGGEVTVADAIQTGNNPTWTTSAGTLATYSYLEDLTANLTIEATDADENATITYSITSGALPTGLTLDTSNGAITGNVENPGAATVTNNFEVTATDNAGNEASRSFNIIRVWKDGSTQALAAPSAAFIFSLDSSYQTANADGIYWIQLPGSNTASQVYCCMDSNVGGGGWMCNYKRTGTADNGSLALTRKDFMYNGTDGYITKTHTDDTTNYPVLPTNTMNFNTLGFTKFMFNNQNASWISALGEFHWGDMVDNAAFTFNTYPVQYYTRSSGATGSMSLYQQTQGWSPGATEGLGNTMNWWSGYYNGSLCGGSGRCNTSACPTTGGNGGSCHFNRNAPYIIFAK